MYIKDYNKFDYPKKNHNTIPSSDCHYTDICVITDMLKLDSESK